MKLIYVKMKRKKLKFYSHATNKLTKKSTSHKAITTLTITKGEKK